MPMRSRAGKTIVAALLVLCGCPKRFDPRADTVRSSPNAEADHAYREARARLDIGDYREAQAQFAAFLQKYPDDPLAPSARLGGARAALGLGEGKKAKELVEPLTTEPGDDPVKEATRLRARWVLGFALHKTGDCARARELLKPFEQQVASGDDAVELRAVLADCAYRQHDYEDALREYSEFFRGARPAEKLFLRDRVAEIVTRLQAPEALRLWNVLPKDGLAAAFLGRRVAVDRRAAGDEAMARAILDESRGARERAGLEEGKAPARREADRAIGLLLPLSGKGRALGERALRGALLGADLVTPALPSGAPIELRVRDTGTDATRAQAAVEELAGENVVAVLLSPERFDAQLATPRAEALGVPVLTLAPDDAQRGPLTFKMVRPRAAAALGLVQHAKAQRVRSLAILAPESAYGRAMAQAIADHARVAGIKVVADVRYPDNATTFIDPVKRLQAVQPDAIVIPAPASQLALIAPQLSASGLSRMPNVKPTGKVAQIYATADGVNDRFLQSTAKYLQGAVLAPTFYPNPSDGRAANFVDRYREAYGEEPSSLDALAFDAVRAIRIALEHADGTVSRAALATQLAHLGESGITGELAFTAAGERAGTPPLLIVDGDGVRAAASPR